MIRTQIYLTEAEQKALRALSRRTGRTQSELIREAVDQYIAGSPKTDRAAILKKARGMWQDRDDLPDFRRMREEFDRMGTSDD